MEENEFNNVNRKMNSLSKAIYVIAIILRVFTIIATVVGILCLFIIPILFSFIQIDNNKISFIDEQFVINFNIPDAELSVENNEGNTTNLSIPFNSMIQAGIEKIMSRGMSFYITIFSILDICFISSSVMVILILKKVEKMFKNIYTNQQIFTKENSNCLRLIAIYMLVTFAIIAVQRTVFGLMLEIRNSLGFDLKYVLYVIVVFAFYYIFEYERLSKEKNGTLGENN